MEKVGYIKRETNTNDARVSYVMLAAGGKRRLEERLEDAEILAKEIIPTKDGKSLEKLTNLLVEIGRSLAY